MASRHGRGRWLPPLLALILWATAGGAQSPRITFDRYHRYTEILEYLRAVATEHRELATLVELGRSRENRPIYAVEINNPQTGPIEEKPAFYVDGNIHGGEVLAGEAALYLIEQLLRRYATDSAIRELVDTRAFYIVPIVNPDGRVISISTPESHRWNTRPVDEDGDGRIDEDPPEDLDGDGRLLQMRIPDTEGAWVASGDDARVMVRRTAESSGPFYRLEREGIDNDRDGLYNEDRVGGIDLNRNFPSNWSPTQFASGPFPLSEPESHALVRYITERPNIAAIHTFHTSGGMILRFPTLADQDWDFPERDLRDYDAIARRGVALTGYDHYASAKQPIIDRMNPGHGVFNDWASSVFGVLAVTTEMWKHPGGRDPFALMAWNDRVLAGRGFIDWRRYDHPQLGTIDLGGWDRWSLSNPPERLIAAELERNFAWVISFAERLPRVAVTRAEVVADQGDVLEVVADVANIGWMSTATAHAIENLGLARPVTVRLELTNAEAASSEPRTRVLGYLRGRRSPAAVSAEPPITWRVRIRDPRRPAWAEIEVRSEKAGVARRRLDLRARIP